MTTSQAPVIECDEFLPYPPETVWRAITDPELLERWWAAASGLRAEVGHRFTLDMGAYGQQACRVVRVEEPRLLSYVFAEGVLDTTLTWTLVPEGAGTRLLLRHEGFDLDSPLGRHALEGMGGGWPLVIARMGPALAEWVG